MLPVYEEELANLKANTEKLKHPQKENQAVSVVKVTVPKDLVVMYAGAPGSYPSPSSATAAMLPLKKGALLYEGRNERIDSIAPELEGLQALVLNRDTTRIEGTTVAFTAKRPVQMLVGFFIDDDPKWAKVPKLETDATGNEYGQAEAVVSNAINMTGMPTVNIHSYHFAAGHHVINLPKGIIMVAGFTETDLKPRDAGLQGAGDEVDWLFQK
jgi:hypothetical protein